VQSCYNNYAAGNLFDMSYIEENVFTKRGIPYAHLSERDIAWSKRIWRVIAVLLNNNYFNNVTCPIYSCGSFEEASVQVTFQT